jgi:hypothetical protein
MKYFFTLVFISLHATLFAQSASHALPIKQHNEALSTFLAQQTAYNTAMKTTALTLKRVIAQSTRDNTLGSLTDSIQLGYSPNMGSLYDFNMMIYPYNYPYATSPMFNFLGVFTKPRVLYDTCIHWTVNPFTLVYGLYEGRWGTYNTGKSLTNFLHLYVDSVTNRNMVYQNTFNTNKDISTGYWFNENMGIADSAFKQFFTYNSSNKLTKDSIYEYRSSTATWKLVSRTFYTYDASNNLTVVNHYANDTDTTFAYPAIEQLRYNNTYDASNRLLTVLTSMFNGTSLVPYIKDTFAYTGTSAFHTSWRQHQFDPIDNSWPPQLNMQKHLNASNLPDTVDIFSFDSLANAWVPSARDVITYDADKNPLVKQNYLYNWTAFPATPDFTTTYYYGTYQTSVAIANAAESKACIFPNPAGDALMISGLGVADNEAITISLLNVNGQILVRQNTRWHNNTAVDMKGLAPGIYFLVVHGAGNTLLHQEQVLKR